MQEQHDKRLTTTLTSRQFNHDTGGAKRAAKKGPVLITHRGERSHVLLTYEDYERLAGREKSLAEALAMPGGEDIDFDPPKMEGPFGNPVDFS